MKYDVVVYYDDMVDSVHTFNNKNEAINELHRTQGRQCHCIARENHRQGNGREALHA